MQLVETMLGLDTPNSLLTSRMFVEIPGEMGLGKLLHIRLCHTQVQLLRSCARLIEDDDDNGVDLCVFCSDGVCWTSKLILAAASPPVRAALAATPDDTCIILPDVTKAEFFAFHR